MSEKYFSDTAVEELVATLQTHNGEEFDVVYREASKPLASEIAVALQKAQWMKLLEVENHDASIPDRPDIEIVTRTNEPKDGIQVLVEWLQDQNCSVNHTYNPKVRAVTIIVEHSD